MDKNQNGLLCKRYCFSWLITHTPDVYIDWLIKALASLLLSISKHLPERNHSGHHSSIWLPSLIQSELLGKWRHSWTESTKAIKIFPCAGCKTTAPHQLAVLSVRKIITYQRKHIELAGDPIKVYLATFKLLIMVNPRLKHWYYQPRAQRNLRMRCTVM